MRFHRRRFFLTITVFILLTGLLSADQTKRNVFDLGFNLGRPGSEGLKDQDLLANDSRIMGNIQKYLGKAVETAEKLGISSASIKKFLADCESFTRAQYMKEGDQVRDRLQAACRIKFGEGAAVIFTMGVWMGGAQNIASTGAQFTRGQRPGTYKLVQRNVGWMQQSAPALGLDTDRIKRLNESLNSRAGISFTSIQDSLENIRDRWREELLNQPGFAIATVLTDANWNTEVVQSDIPVLVVFGANFNPPSARLISTVKGMAKKYEGKVKFLTADPKDCPKTCRKEKIMSMPLIRIYNKGAKMGELIGNQPAEAISRFIDETISTGLLGIVMDKPSIKRISL
jgi:thioredoxin 1